MSQVEYDVDEIEEIDGEEDERKGQGEDEDLVIVQDDDLDQEERRAGHDEDEETEDEKKARRREENKTRRQRQREARDRADRELRFLRKRNEDLERRFSEFEANTEAQMVQGHAVQIDQQISKVKSDIELANQVVAEAIEKNDGAAVTEAMTHRDNARDELNRLQYARENLEQAAPQQQRAPQPDARQTAHAQRFVADHDWWDPNGRDADSAAVLAIDLQLAEEAYDPSTKEYWDELRSRVQEQLPHRFDDQDGGDDTGEQQQQQRGDARRGKGPKFSSGGRERPLRKNEVYVSRERREAMEEAGVWDDPVLRARYLKSYQEYDQGAGGQ